MYTWSKRPYMYIITDQRIDGVREVDGYRYSLHTKTFIVKAADPDNKECMNARRLNHNFE